MYALAGHQWLNHEFSIRPESAWSVDPFGHGATLPYVLKNAGLEQMVIQRIHFAWKEWLAAQQAGDFKWRQPWDPSGAKGDILCHNMPYDIYSIKHTCGPHHEICLAFDFRKIHGELTEFTVRSQDIDDANIHDKAATLIEEYRRTASLYPHNVVLVPVGDDFRLGYISYLSYSKRPDHMETEPLDNFLCSVYFCNAVGP
jgi:alpha-mannosidase